VSGGYSANLLIGTVDPLLAGITQEAARLIDPATSRRRGQLVLHDRSAPS
jgi:p-aminobenzoyl-glutamate transporter AbgT